MRSSRFRFILLLLVVAPILLPPASVHAVTPKDCTGGITGNWRLIVVRFSFFDKTFSKSIEEIESFLKPVNDYYKENSYDFVNIVGTVYEKTLTLPNSKAYYSSSVESQNDVADAVGSAMIRRLNVEPFDFGKYDTVALAYAGDPIGSPFASLGRSNLVGGAGYMVVAEHATLVAYVHELGHNLGLPDLYDVVLASRGKPSSIYMGTWDIMSGSRSPDQPAHLSAWSKIQLGWICPQHIRNVELGSRSSVALPPIATFSIGDMVARIELPNGQYYLLEVRMPFGFDKNAPGSGVLLTRYDGTRIRVVRFARSLDNAAFKAGDEFEDAKNYFRLTVSAKGDQSYTFTAERSGAPSITVKTGVPNVQVSISPPFFATKSLVTGLDGAVTVYVYPGRVSVSVPAIVDSRKPGMRFAFKRWTDGSVQISKVLDVKQDVTVETVFGVQYLLTVSTEWFTISGGGWYDEGTTALIELAGVTIEKSDIWGVLGAKKKFVGWSGDLQSSDNPAKVIMTSPKNVAAVWTDDYSQTYTFLTIIGVASALLITLAFVRAKSKRGVTKKVARKPMNQ